MSSAVFSQFGGLTLVTPPAATVVSVADMKAHSRVVIGRDDGLLAGYILSATQLAETITRRAFMPQTWRLALQHWPGRDNVAGPRQYSSPSDFYKWNFIELPLPPLVSIASFTYMDPQGNLQSMTQGFGNAAGNYTLDLDSEPGRVMLPFAGLWPPIILSPMNPIQITYRCGYPAYAGIVNVSPLGAVTWVSGDKFNPQITGSWITVAGPQNSSSSYSVLTIQDDTHLQIVPPTPAWPLVPGTNLAYTANATPISIRHAVLLSAAHFYENREAVTLSGMPMQLPMSAKALLAPYKTMRQAA